MSESVGELLRRVDRSLDDHADADRTTRIVESLTNLENQLSPHIEGLGQVIAAFDALGQVGMPAERPDTRSVAVACREAGELVRQNKSVPQDLHRTLRDINEVVNAAKGTARDAWREFIYASIPALNSLNDLAGMLSRMRADERQLANLRNGAADLRALSRSLPDESAPDQATRAFAAIRGSLMALLGDSDADNEVGLFILNVARGGAHVRALTTVVKDWMRQNGFEDSFKIVAGRPANE
jgi:hypothetical protein